MNERIKKLAEQATTYIDPSANDGVCWNFDKEKFAELIVRECAEMVRIQNEQFMANESHYGVVSTDVLKHFGVEQ